MNNKRIIFNNIYMLKYLFKYVPMYVIGALAFGMIMAIPSVFANVVLLKYVIDTAASGINLINILIAVCIFAVFIIISQIANSLFNSLYVPKAKEKLHVKMQSELYEKALTLDLACYDNPDFYNDFIWAMSSAENRAIQTLSNIQMFLGNLLNFIVVITIFATIDVEIIILVLFAAIITMFFNNPIAKLSFEKENEMRPLYRKRDYIARVFYLPNYAKEIRLSNVERILKRDYKKNNDEILKTAKKHNKKLWILNFFRIYISGFFIVNFIIVLYLGYKVIVVKSNSVGDFAAVFNGVNTILAALYFFLGDFISRTKENGLFIEKFRAFLQYESKIIGGKLIADAETPHILDLKNVTFFYENKKEPTLKNITLSILPYQKIALVGYNGAGKTTLVKLLMRLYDSTNGTIKMDGENIKNYTLESYKSCFSALFQDYQIFATSIAKNVSMDTIFDVEQVKTALDESDFTSKLSSLSCGIETPLLREFEDNGVLLSGGETQKIAIASAFYKNSPFIILDEPSAALDPVTEYNLNQTMAKAANNKTVIFISHRLSTTKMADVIYMLDNGQIIESGTHKELMHLNGKYAQMFELQARNYRKQNNETEELNVFV